MKRSDQPAPTFTLVRYNPRRRARGAEAAEVRADWPDGESETLWMSERDIRANVKWYGAAPGLTAALEAYKKNEPFPVEP